MLTIVEETDKREPTTHLVQKVIGGDTYLVMAQSSVELEDEFNNLYYTTAEGSKLFLQPPFEPTVLKTLVNTNNTLGQCVESMEVNIDGTGYSFVGIEEGEDPNESEVDLAQEFFGEPYPNESFTKIRRKLRRDMESVGYGFLEVLRNLEGKVVGLRNVETPHVRMVKLDAPIQVQKTIMRNGKEVEMTLWERERRFAQRVAMKELVYYREFGTTREVNRMTGEWESEANPITPEDRGTELLMFGIHPDTTTPYFIPRWINQLPSVVGSRKAEEQNLQFLDSGGMPPAIIFVQGGTLAKDASDQLKMYLSGQNKNKYRAAVVEAQSSSGSLDAAGSVQVKVERFGSQAAQDAMFMKYDEATEEHVRKGFRLPPLFIGKSEDQNFATASVSYMVAEAQVFGPERVAFDELINKTIMKELGFKTIKFKSNPITMKDVSSQLTGMGMVKDLATRESFLKEVNTTTGMNLNLASMPQPDTISETMDENGNSTKDSTVPDNLLTVSQTPHEELPASTKPPIATPQSQVKQLPPKDPKNPKSKVQKFNPNHDKQGRFATAEGNIFVSPNEKEDLTFDQAVQGLGSKEQSSMKTLAADVIEKIDSGGEVHNAIGDWSDGAENSLVLMPHTKDRDKVRYMAAVLGDHANQKAVIPFIPDSKGKDSVWTFEVPEDLDKTRETLNKFGVQFRTLEKKSSGTHVYIFDPGSSLRGKMEELGEHYDKSIGRIKGTGEFVGGDTREEGRQAYSKIFEQYEGKNKPYPRHNGSVSGQSDNSYGAKAAQELTALELIDLAHDYAASKGLIQKEVSEERKLVLKEELENLTVKDLEAFHTLVAQYTFGSDEPGLVSIASYHGH